MSNIQTEVYTESVKIRDRVIKFRKWKAKDRKTFIMLMSQEKPQEAVNSLVYDCLEKETALSPEEFRYVLSSIRAASIGKEITFKLQCDSCEEEYVIKKDIDKILKPEFAELCTIENNGTSIELCEVKNKQYYDKALLSCKTESELYNTDLLYHISLLNGSDAFTFSSLEEYFDNIDLDTLDAIYDEWDKIKFKVNDVNTVKCTHCGNEETYKFDEIPDFFPSKWFSRK